jgi:hypothetical protein
MRGGGIRGRMVEKPIILCGKEGTLWIRTPSQQLSSSMKTSPTWSACQLLHICWSCASKIQFSQNSAIRELSTSATPQTVVNVFRGKKKIVSHWKSVIWSQARWLKRCQVALISVNIFLDDTWQDYRLSHVLGLLFILNGRTKSSFACKWPE